MIKAICFRDNHTGKQTHEKEATSVSHFSVKAVVSVFAFGRFFCDHETYRGGQEAIFASLSVPSNKQPVHWLVKFLSIL